jgi:epoxyqueuosine reductase
VTQDQVKALLDKSMTELGFSQYGLATLEKPLSFAYYEAWLAEGLHGDMKYLSEHAPIKEDAQRQWPRAKSALVFAMPYFPHPEKTPDSPLKSARVSLYAQGYDYHFWFRGRMQKLCEDLKALFPDEDFIAFTDSSPVLERDLAQRAGLGWVGKNTCLIHPKKGSLFFIGEIYTSLDFKVDIAPLPDFCGTCTRCMDICPTGALVSPKKMDARKCISYLTIESREVPPEELRPQIHDWFFGCDLCQTVCPWNQKVFKGQLSVETSLTLSTSEEASLTADLRYILESSGKKLGRDFAGTPLARAGSFGLKRNALIVIANRGLKELKPLVESYHQHEKLGELSQWASRQL